MELMVRDASPHFDSESAVMASGPVELDLYEELVAFSQLSPEQQAEAARRLAIEQAAERPAPAKPTFDNPAFGADLSEEQFLESAMAQLNARMPTEPAAHHSGGGPEAKMNTNNGSGSLAPEPSGSLPNPASPQPAAPGGASGPLKLTGPLGQPAGGTTYINCPACGSRSASNDIFCIACGSLLEE